MAQVLAAIDLTPLGRRVADRARMLAEDTDGSLTLLHTVEPATDAFVPEPIADLLAEHQVEAAGEMADWVRARTSIEVDLRLSKGSPSWEIARAAKSADVAVVGSTSLETGQTGAVARRVAETIRTDVLIVRRQPRVPYRRVVVGVDLSAVSATAVDRVVELVEGAEITLVFALATRFEGFMSDAGMFSEEIDLTRKRRLEAAEAAMEQFAARWPDVRTVIASGPAPEVINEVARRRSADLVAVASRGGNATRMVLLGSVPSILIDQAPCDLLIVRVPSDFRRP